MTGAREAWVCPQSGSSCSVTLGNPTDLSGHPASPVQVRGIGQQISSGPVSQKMGQAHSALRPIGTPRKVFFLVILPRVEVSSPQPISQHSTWELLDWSSESARQRIQSSGGTSRLEGESAEEVKCLGLQR